MAAMVLLAILQDARYPASLYTDTLIRIRAEQGRSNMGKSCNHKSIYDKKLQKYGRGYIYGLK